MAATKNESFKNLTEYLKKLKELDDTAVKNSSLIDELKSSTLFSAAGNKEQPTKVDDKGSSASLSKFNEKILKSEEDKDKLFREINDNLKEIKKALQGNTPDKKVGGGPGRSDTSPGALPKADNLTFTEKLKSAVAGVKGAGNKVMGLGEKVVGATTGAVEGLISDPKGFAKKAFGSLKGTLTGAVTSVTKKADSVGKYVEDVVSTKADYTPEQERFADVMSHTKGNTLKQGKKSAKELAGETFNKIQSKQKEIDEYKADSQKKIDEQKGIMQKFKDQGFEPRKKDTDKLASLEKNRDKNLANLEKELAAVDPRVKKDDTDKRETKVESKKERDVSEQALAASNPNADNVESSSEKISKEIADNNKTLSALLTVATSQLTSLNAIKDALAPSNPKEQEAKGQKPREPDIAPGGEAAKGGLLDTVGDLANLIPEKGGKPAAGKGLGSKIKGAFKGMSGLAKASGALAVGVGAYDAYSNYKEAGEEGQAKLEQIDADVKAGKITPKEAEDLKKQTNEATVEKKGEGIGAGAGTAIGGALGAVAGSVLGPVGTIAGGYLGAKAGEFVGGKVGKLGGQIANYFSGNKDTPVDSAAPSTISTTTEGGGDDLEALQAKRDKLAKQGPATDSPQSILAHKNLLGTLDKAIEDKKNSKPTEGKSSEAKSITPVDGRSAMVKLREEGRRTTFGTLYESTPSVMKTANNLSDQATKLGIDPNNAVGTYEGGVLTKITDKVSGKENQVAVPEESKAKVEAARNLKGNMGSDVAKTSTENADMEREANKGSGGNNTVVSNNVSSNNTTKYVPMKASPRPESQGSALDRYQNRITVY